MARSGAAPTTGSRSPGAAAAVAVAENGASLRVMEKLGMTLVRRFRLTADEIVQSDTYHAESVEVWDGDDASCLNLYRPQNPRLLGVSDELVE